MTIHFLTKTTLPLECITTFGVNVKTNNNPIGYFGTGLKYALAVLAREGCAVSIRIGLDVYDVRKESAQVRGKDFDFIYLNDIQLPFTTELGKKWELWQAYRELYSNTLDEKGIIEDNLNFNHKAYDTVITVDNWEFDKVHDDRWSHFMNPDIDILYKAKNIDVFRNIGQQAVFYKGIKVLEIEDLYFSYNLTANYGINLTEDRTISSWDFEYFLTQAVVTLSNLEFVDAFLAIEGNFWETCMQFHKYIEPSSSFLNMLNTYKDKPQLKGYCEHYTPRIIANEYKNIPDNLARKLSRLRKKYNIDEKYILGFSKIDKDYKIESNIIIFNNSIVNKPKKLNLATLIAAEVTRGKSEYNAFADNIGEIVSILG